MRVEDADQSFFAALRAADGAALATLLTDDFVLVDVMRGAEVPRALFGAGTVDQEAFVRLSLSRIRSACFPGKSSEILEPEAVAPAGPVA
jgi:hypothetical protein